MGSREVDRADPGRSSAKNASPEPSRDRATETTGAGLRCRQATRIPSLLGRLLLLAFSSATILLIGELAVRTLSPQPFLTLRPDLWVPDDTGLGHRLASGVDTTINSGERDVRFMTNAHGHRIGEAKGSSRAPDLRVLALGDSFLEAVAVSYEDTFPAVLERSLSRRLGREVAIVNAGVSATSPHHYLARARHELADARYDLVLVSLFAGNDVVSRRVDRIPPRQPTPVGRLRWPETASMRGLVDAVVHPLWTRLRRHSQLAVWSKGRMLPVLVRLGFTDHAFPRVLLRANAVDPMFDYTLDLCDQIATTAIENGAATTFLLIPPDYQIDPEMGLAFARGAGLRVDEVDLDQVTALLGSGLVARGHEVVDASPFLRDAKRSGRAVYGRVDRHLSPDGHAAVAAALEPPLARRLAAVSEIPRRPPDTQGPPHRQDPGPTPTRGGS